MRKRGAQGDRASERVADERRGQKRVDELDERERLGRERRSAPAGKVGRDDVIALAERGDLALPEPRVAERGMEEDDLLQESSSSVRSSSSFDVAPRMSSSSSCRFVPSSSCSISVGSGFSIMCLL
jgi:hypothetical protein